MEKQHINDIVNVATEFEKTDVQCPNDYMTVEKQLQKEYSFGVQAYNSGKSKQMPILPNHAKVIDALKSNYLGCELIGDYKQ